MKVMDREQFHLDSPGSQTFSVLEKRKILSGALALPGAPRWNGGHDGLVRHTKSTWIPGLQAGSMTLQRKLSICHSSDTKCF